MSPEFTDDDIGKSVINADGEEVGLVTDVEHGTAHVEPDPGITDTIKAKLGWGDTDDDAYPLQEPAVAEVTDDEVHLERDLDSSSTSTGAAAGAGTGAETDDVDASDTHVAGSDDPARESQTDDDLIGDDDDDLIGDDDDDGLIGDDDDDDLIGDDDDDLVGDDDDDDLIGDDDDDDLVGDDDDDLIGDDDDTRTR
jgi:hypothetical protein